jgi:hypothetical protein
MRYALIILALFFCTIKTEAQVYQAMPQAGYGPVKRMLIDSVLTIPIGISQLRNITGGRDTAQIRYQKSDSSVYVYTGSSWVRLGTGGGGGGGSADSTVFFTVYRADTMRANIYASIVTTDSSVYFTKYRSDTMRANLYSYIKNADSLTYFTKYRSDTMRANIYGAIPQPDTLFALYPIRISNDSIYLAQSFVDSVGTGGGGGGAGTINYYLNGSISQGTFGGTTYYQLSQNPIFGAGTNFTRTNGDGNGYIASFITDANDPNVLGIPGGNWNLEFYFNANSSGGSPQFYAEVYKYDGSTFTLLASGSTNPETITNGSTVDQYYTSIPVPTTTLLATDRIAVRVYVIPGGRTITLHTENSNLSEVLTTLTIPAWKTNGNSDVNAGRFLGSTNNASVRFRTNNVERMVLDSIGGLKMASVANNGTLANALQLANTDNRSFFNISTDGTITNLTLKANNNAVLDSMVISDSGLIAPRTNASLWLKPTQTGNNNVVANRCAGCGSGSIFSANVGTSAPIFNMLSTGQMAINGETPASTAALDITSTSRGLLIPRMTTSQRNAISSPATQLIVANSDDKTIDMYNGTSWNTIAGGFSRSLTAYRLMGSTIQAEPIPSLANINSSGGITSTRSYYNAILVDKEITITGVTWYQVTQGVYTNVSTDVNQVGLYSYSGGTLTLIDTSTRDNNLWKASSGTWGQKALANGTRTLQPGLYYIGTLYIGNASVTPSLASYALNAAASSPLTTNSAKLFGSIASGVTILPSTQAMSGLFSAGYLAVALY